MLAKASLQSYLCSMSTVKPSAESLRALAHPLRVRMLTLLRTHGPATATRLAEPTGEPTVSTSYHLRQAAAHGLDEAGPPRGNARERWWKASHGTTVIEAEQVRQSPADAEAYLRAVAVFYADRMQRWITEAQSLPSEWDEACTLSDDALRLTSAEATELLGRMVALIGEYRRDRPENEPPDGAERVVIQYQLLPFPGGAV